MVVVLIVLVNYPVLFSWIFVYDASPLQWSFSLLSNRDFSTFGSALFSVTKIDDFVSLVFCWLLISQSKLYFKSFRYRVRSFARCLSIPLCFFFSLLILHYVMIYTYFKGFFSRIIPKQRCVILVFPSFTYANYSVAASNYIVFVFVSSLDFYLIFSSYLPYAGGSLQHNFLGGCWLLVSMRCKWTEMKWAKRIS